MWHSSRTRFVRVSDPPGAPAPDDRQTILLVDDEEPVRRLLSTVLDNAGFRVLAASGLPDAMAMEAGHEGPIHLLITDLMMPDMDGRMVARAIIERRPSCRVLFISGYPADSVDLEGIAAAFLQKPFVPRALVTRVRELLQQ
jgi:two-component system cell cycle sensor histidine kinase/response regulator CckA